MPLPKIRFATKKWLTQVELTQIITSIINGRSVESTENLKTRAIVQPWQPKDYEMKASYERSLSYIMVHAEIQPRLKNASYVSYQEKKYRILKQNDYSQAGFMEYLCVIDTAEDE